MENEIQIFNNPAFGDIRTIVDENKTPWFVGKDVAEVLGYKDSVNALKTHVDPEDSMGWQITTPSRGRQNIKVINESGLYSLILSSKLPQAKEFKRWVTSVVLPQIRKTGGYIPIKEEDDEKTILCKALSIMKRTVEQKDKLLEEQKPLVHFANAITASDGSILIGEMAKILNQNGFKTGRKRFFKWLRDHEYLFKQSREPIQKWVDEGIFELHATVVSTDHGDIERLTTKVTGKGQKYFLDLLTKSPVSPSLESEKKVSGNS